MPKIEEYIYGDGICVLEWAEMIQENLPPNRFDVHLFLGSVENERTIFIEKR